MKPIIGIIQLVDEEKVSLKIFKEFVSHCK